MYATFYTRALMRISRSHVAPGFLISANYGALVTVKGEARVLSSGVMRMKSAPAERLSLQFDRRMETQSGLGCAASRERMMYVVPFTSVTHSAFIPHHRYAFGMILWLDDQKQDQRFGAGEKAHLAEMTQVGCRRKWKRTRRFPK